MLFSLNSAHSPQIELGCHQPADGRGDRPTNPLSHRDARTHLRRHLPPTSPKERAIRPTPLLPPIGKGKRCVGTKEDGALCHPRLHSLQSVFSSSPLWSKITKNPDVNTGPLALPFAHSPVLHTHSLAPHCSLRSHAPLRSLVHLIVHSLACGKVYD